MFPFFRERIAYGRAVRDEAERLIAQHGVHAVAAAEAAKALAAGEDPARHAFFDAVGLRVARVTGAGVGAEARTFGWPLTA